MRLNLDLFGQPYTSSTVVLRRLKALLPAQELVIFNLIYIYSAKFRANYTITEIPDECPPRTNAHLEPLFIKYFNHG